MMSCNYPLANVFYDQLQASFLKLIRLSLMYKAVRSFISDVRSAIMDS